MTITELMNVLVEAMVNGDIDVSSEILNARLDPARITINKEHGHVVVE